MIFFSNAGLLELRMMVQQAAPFIGQDDYARLWAIVEAVGSDGAMSEQNYDQMVSIIEPYLLQRDVPTTAKKDSCTQTRRPQRSEETADNEAILLALRYYLLSYAGVANLENRLTIQGTENGLEQEMGGLYG